MDSFDRPGLRGIVPRADRPFTCLLVGDERLPASVYPAFAARLDRLLSAHLPRVEATVYGGRSADHGLLSRYCRERGLHWCTVEMRPSDFVRSARANAVVVFDTGDPIAAQAVEQAFGVGEKLGPELFVGDQPADEHLDGSVHLIRPRPRPKASSGPDRAGRRLDGENR